MNFKERLGEEIAELAGRIDAATYQLLVLIREFDEKEGWNCGFLNCAQWLVWRISLAPGAARERVRIARALGKLPLMSEAMKRGELSYSKVRALTRVARPDTEKELVDLGRAGTAAHVEQVVRAWRKIDRSVEASDDELRDASSQVSTHIDENGMVVIRGRLAPEAGEVLMKALEAAGDKLFAEQEREDRPPVGKVRADALALVAESALAGGLDSGTGGDRYQVVVHVNDRELEAPEPAATKNRPHVPAGTSRQPEVQANGAAEVNGHVPAGTPGQPEVQANRAAEVSDRVRAGTPRQPEVQANGGAEVNGHVPAGTSRQPEVQANRAAEVSDRVPAGTSGQPEVRANGAAGADGHVPAGTSGDPARHSVAAEPARTESADCVHSAGAWVGKSHVRVSAETARRIACDAGKVVMQHRSGQILSVGRKTRTIPPPIRRALEFRDRGCRFPGCTSQHCDAHHIEHWADGGETKLSNLVLLCRRHHRLLHEGGFSLRMDDQGAVGFYNPRGRLLERSPAPPVVGDDAARELIEHLEDAGILITGDESMPAWNGEPMDLRYVMECLWRPPPHLEAIVARERRTSKAACTSSASP